VLESNIVSASCEAGKCPPGYGPILAEKGWSTRPRKTQVSECETWGTRLFSAPRDVRTADGAIRWHSGPVPRRRQCRSFHAKLDAQVLRGS